MNANEFALAVQNTLIQNLENHKRGSRYNSSYSGAAIQAEAQQKECDYVVYTNVSHKKGWRRFWQRVRQFRRIKLAAASVTAGALPQPSRRMTVVAATVSQNIKAKDELTHRREGGAARQHDASFAQQYKGKAKSAGEDIITPLVQQASPGYGRHCHKQ